MAIQLVPESIEQLFEKSKHIRNKKVKSSSNRDEAVAALEKKLAELKKAGGGDKKQTTMQKQADIKDLEDKIAKFKAKK
jgi:multidrug resistance efflux pump